MNKTFENGQHVTVESHPGTYEIVDSGFYNAVHASRLYKVESLPLRDVRFFVAEGELTLGENDEVMTTFTLPDWVLISTISVIVSAFISFIYRRNEEK